MPVPPYAWQTNDYVTAHRLNSELRQTNGQPFLPNGTGWHAARPVFKSYTQANLPGAPSGSWQQYYNSVATYWQSIVDTGFWVGAKYDEGNNGQLNGADMPNGGSYANQWGGLHVYTHNAAFGTAAPTNSGGVSIANYDNPSTSWKNYSQGQLTPLNANQGVNPWMLDLVDTDGMALGFAGGDSRWTGQYQAGGSPGWNSHNGDGSGAQVRQAAFWACGSYVNPGALATSINAVTQTYTGGTPITSAMLNAQIQQSMALLNNPPVCRVASADTGGVGVACASGTNTVIPYPASSVAPYNVDNFNKWNTTTNSYSTPFAGLYLVAAFTAWPSGTGSGTQLRTGVTVGGTNYNGPITMGNNGACTTAKVQVFNLAANTTIQQYGNQNSGGSITTVGNVWNGSYMVIVYLGPANTPGTLPTVPDVTYLFQAGTPAAQMPGVLSNYVGNDLTFLMSRPYLLHYQTTAQTGITMSLDTPITLNGVRQDNFNGWNTLSNIYTAVVPGWYLAVGEVMMAAPTLTGGSHCLGFQLTPAGSVAADRYGQQTAVSSVAGGGAAGVGLYYLRAGDSIVPSVLTNATSATTTATYVNSAPNWQSHFELVWLGQ